SGCIDNDWYYPPKYIKDYPPGANFCVDHPSNIHIAFLPEFNIIGLIGFKTQLHWVTPHFLCPGQGDFMDYGEQFERPHIFGLDGSNNLFLTMQMETLYFPYMENTKPNRMKTK